MSIARRRRALRIWCTRLALLTLAAVSFDCAPGDGSGSMGRGGSSGGVPSSIGGSAGAASGGGQAGGGSAGESGGPTGSGGAGGNGGDSSGGDASSGAGASGTNGQPDAGGSPALDAAGADLPSAGDSGGADDNAAGKSCAGNAISLSANGTGTASDAAQSRVLVDVMSDLPLGNAARTVEFWAYIKPTDWVGERNAIYIYGPQSAPASTFGLDFGTFTVNGMAGNHATLNPVTNGGFNDDSRNDLGITSAAAQWVHIAMTWDGTAVKTYVNGVLRITSPGKNGITALATLNSPLSMGCNPNNKACFSGLFDEFRLWKVARTDAEIGASYRKALVGNEAGLVGYWKFDEAPGASMAADSVTTAGHVGHPGMLSAASAGQGPTFVTPDPPPPVMCP